MSRETSASACAGKTVVKYATFCETPPAASEIATTAAAATAKRNARRGKRNEEPQRRRQRDVRLDHGEPHRGRTEPGATAVHRIRGPEDRGKSQRHDVPRSKRGKAEGKAERGEGNGKRLRRKSGQRQNRQQNCAG